ncbi:TetR/AcrR family transcriptional regulator [Amycolatopsis minnesotensis]|uniref:TetR/AcrR family transcriptional regulator n=1 Tax=Amycolatopsis minnesotensis TaxID=337894 RepID=A0ABN2Q2N1_9PSEU
MTSTEKPRRLRPEKRRAIVDAARAAFGKLGYVRAGTDAIAAEAGVSTRTLYNHFPTKLDLFRSVFTEGAATVAAGFTERIDALPGGADAESTVRGIARALVAHRLDFPEHFAMARYADIEREHFPAETFDHWRTSGPQAVTRAVTARLERLTADGLLATADPGEAADQLILLIAGAVAFRQRPGVTVSEHDAERIVRSGVRTFLYGHSPR